MTPKLQRTIIPWLVAFLMFLWVLTIQPVHSNPQVPQTIITVNTTEDEYGTGGSCSLREAIQSANTDADFGGCLRFSSGLDAIMIPAGTYRLTLHGSSENNNTTGDLDIRSAMGFYGVSASETIIHGDGDTSETDRVFHVVEDDFNDFIVTMWDLTITAGNSGNANGGGVLNEESLWISRVSIHSNQNNANGAGVYSDPENDGQSFRAYMNSVIDENSTSLGSGGGIYISNQDLFLEHAFISNNSAVSGAGICLQAGDSVITWSNIDDNMAAGDGGGIYQNGGRLYLTDSSLSDNSTGGNGGNIMITDQSISSDITRAFLGNGHANSGSGAGIFNAGLLKIWTSTITNNVADHAAGIYHSSTSISPVSLIIKDSTIALNNTGAPAGQAGEGLYNAQNLTNIEIQDSIFTGNGDPGSTDNNCYSADPARLVSLGNNLESGDSCQFSQASDLTDTDPLLDGLDYHGGFSLNYTLEASSLAFETGSGCLSTDQRGATRPMDQDRDGIALCDIGAVEAEPFFLPLIRWFPLIRKP